MANDVSEKYKTPIHSCPKDTFVLFDNKNKGWQRVPNRNGK